MLCAYLPFAFANTIHRLTGWDSWVASALHASKTRVQLRVQNEPHHESSEFCAVWWAYRDAQVSAPIGSNRAPSSTRVASILGIIGGDGGSQGGAVRLDELKRVQTC